MKNNNIPVRTALALIISICSITQAVTANEVPNNSLNFELIAATDSEKTLGRHYTVTRYLDELCNKPKKNAKLLRKKYVKNQHQFEPLSVPTNELFIFQVDYSEKRRDSERSCAASVGFTPKDGRRYKAVSEVSGQVSRCLIKLYDVTDGEQELEPELRPKTMCTRKGATGNGNGVPSHSMIERF